MKKRIVTLLLALLIICSLTPMDTLAASNDPKLEYWIDDEYAYAQGCSSTFKGDLVIPDYVQGKPVHGISPQAFHNHSGIKSVLLPKTIDTIGAEAFLGCSSLEKVVLPENLTSIEPMAFGDCTSLKSINLPESLTWIGEWAFAHCTSLKSIKIPDGVTSLGRREDNVNQGGLFVGCSSLTKVTLPKDISFIPESMFMDCTSLVSVNIPSSVKEIEQGAFYGCSSLDKITVSAKVESISTGIYGAFAQCRGIVQVAGDNPHFSSIDGVLFNKDQSVLLQYPSWKEGEYIVPDTVKEISDGAFSFCDKLTKVTFPKGLQVIGEFGFRSCEGLTQIALPDSVTSMGGDAFSGCHLTSIALSNKLKEIPEEALSCNDFETVVIPKSVTDIGERAFRSCNNLSVMAIMNPNVRIQEQNDDVSEFSGIKDVLFAGTKQEWKRANTGNTAFQNIQIHYNVTDPTSHLKDSVVSSADGSGRHTVRTCSCGYKISDNERFSYALHEIVPGAEPLAEIIRFWHSYVGGNVLVPEKIDDALVISIQTDCFAGCTFLESVELPNSIEWIHDRAFLNCSNLKKIDMSENLKSISEDAFKGCSSLKTLSIPLSTKEIEAHAAKDSGLKDIYYGGCSEEQWNGIQIDPKNAEIKQAIIHYRAHSWDAGTLDDGGLRHYTCTSCGETKTAVEKRAKSGVKVLAEPAQAAALNSVTLVAEKNTNETKAAANVVVKSVSGVKATHAYDIHLENAKGMSVQPKSAITVVIPLPDGWDPNGVAVYYVDPNSGKTENMNAVVSSDGRTVSFETTHFSCYVLTQTNTNVDPAPASGTKFQDVKKDAYYYDPVAWAVNHDPVVTTGMDDTHFAPNKDCTRAQMVTFLWRAAGEPKPASAKNPFKDVKKGAYYYYAVLWAVGEGITTGTGKNTFSPDATVTRAQTVTFLWRMENEPAVKAKNPFQDVKKGTYYYDAVLWAVANNITTGKTAKTFAPGDPCTRAQIVTFLYRDLG